MTDDLVRCGYPRCPGDVMATNPRWRQPLAGWRREFSSWLHEPVPDAVLGASIFFDMRPVHGDAALSEEVRLGAFPNSRLKGEANLLIMPTLDAANIAFNLLKAAAGSGVTLGPILLGVAKPVHILTPSATVRRIVNMTALTVVDSQTQRQTSLL